MFLLAHHVLRPQTGEEGFNAYHYAHANFSQWEMGPPEGVPDQDPGELVKTLTPVTPGGNRIRSFLEIVASDDATWNEVHGNFRWFILECEGQPFPWMRRTGQYAFKAAMEGALAANWRDELGSLYEAAHDVRGAGAEDGEFFHVGARYAPAGIGPARLAANAKQRGDLAATLRYAQMALDSDADAVAGRAAGRPVRRDNVHGNAWSGFVQQITDGQLQGW